MVTSLLYETFQPLQQSTKNILQQAAIQQTATPEISFFQLNNELHEFSLNDDQPTHHYSFL
jgi:hypothetical protein